MNVKKLMAIGLFSVAVALTVSFAFAVPVDAVWDLPTEREDGSPLDSSEIESVRIYCKTLNGSEAPTLRASYIGPVTSGTWEMSPGEYECHAAAFAGQESAPSNTQTFQVVAARPNPPTNFIVDTAGASVIVVGDPSAIPGSQDFTSRCADSGVIWCDGFDDIDDYQDNWQVLQGSGPDSGVWIGGSGYGELPKEYPNNITGAAHQSPGLYYPSIDTTAVDVVPVSGAGVLRHIANVGESDTTIGGNAARGDQYTSSGAPSSTWDRSVPANDSSTETFYFQIRIYFSEDLADFDWGTVATGGSPKHFVFGDDASCSKLETYWAPYIYGESAGFASACGGESWFWEQSGASSSKLLGIDYPPLTGHIQDLYNMGPEGPTVQAQRDNGDDFYCMRNNTNDTNCLRTGGTGDTWWTMYCAYTLTPDGEDGDHMSCYVYRPGTDQNFRQFMDSYRAGDGFDKDQGPVSGQDECCVKTWMFKIQPNSSGNMPLIGSAEKDQFVAYDELIVSHEPIPVPDDDGHGSSIPTGPHDVTCSDGKRYIGFCPGDLP